MESKTCYKLTNQDMTTHNGYQWELNKWNKVPAKAGDGNLCSGSFLHAYTDPVLALFLNPIHANIQNVRLFKAESRGRFADDHGLKIGYSQMRLVEELPVKMPTTEQRVKFAILCAMRVYDHPDFLDWCHKWLIGEDRSQDAAAEAAERAAADAAAAWAAAAADADAAAAWADAAAAWAAEDTATAAAEAAERAAWAAAETATAAADAAERAAWAAAETKPIDLIAIAHKAMEN